METTTLCVAATLAGSPADVYGILTDSRRHSAMTGAESKIDARKGGEFSYFGGGVTGVMKRLEKDVRIVQELRGDGWPEGHHARVDYELKPLAQGRRTHVEVAEAGVPLDRLPEVIEGWQGYWEAFANFLREERVDVIRCFIDRYKNRQDPDAVDEFVAEDCSVHIPLPGLPPGREGMRVNGRRMCGAFPDVHANREFFVTEGDIVIERANVTATHEGELMGTAATEKPITWTELHAYRVTDGLISEVWSEADFMGVMVQIGAVRLLD